MPRIMMGTLIGADQARIHRISQDLADAVIGGNAVIRVLVEQSQTTPRVVITLEQDAADRLIGRYELEPNVWVNVDRIVSLTRLLCFDSWTLFERYAPIPRKRRRAARTP